MMTLLEAVRQVMNDKAIRAKYPAGLSSVDVLREIRIKFGADVYPYCTVIDIADELRRIYE